jgi:hypothetical protein
LINRKFALLAGIDCSIHCLVSGKNSAAMNSDTDSVSCIAAIGFDCTTDYTNCSCFASFIAAGASVFSLCHKSHSN